MRSAASVLPVLQRRALILAASIIVVDQLTKVWAVAVLEGQPRRRILGELLGLDFGRNPGAAFSIGTSNTIVFTIISSVIVVLLLTIALPRVTHAGWSWALGGMLGGAVGNLIDRLVRDPGFPVGHVVDFLRLPNFPIFNIADMAISFSVTAMILMSLRGHEPWPPRASST